MLTQNGHGDDEVSGTASEEAQESKIQRKTSIKGMWKKAVKSLKPNDKLLSKKGSVVKKKEDVVEEDDVNEVKDVDPVYSLLKSAAGLPRTQKEKEMGAAGPGVSGVPHHETRQPSLEPPVVSKRENMHHIVDESMGSEFKTFYKLTSPVKKTIPLMSEVKKNSGKSHQTFDHY